MTISSRTNYMTLTPFYLIVNLPKKSCSSATGGLALPQTGGTIQKRFNINILDSHIFLDSNEQKSINCMLCQIVIHNVKSRSYDMQSFDT